MPFSDEEIDRLAAEREAAAAAAESARDVREVLVRSRLEERIARRDTRRPVVREIDPTRVFSYRHAAELGECGFVRTRDSKARAGRPRGGPYLPVEPLIALCPEMSIIGLSRSMDVEYANVQRARREGLTWAQADRWAVARGFHPSEVWDMAWWASVDVEKGVSA